MPFKQRVVVCVLAVMAVALSACGSDDAQPDETTTTSSEQPTQEKPSSDDGSESKDEAGGGLDVTVAGDQGVLALQYSGSVPEGKAGPARGKLITGPGGCFALTRKGPPQLLVFPDDAKFVLKHGKPSATVDGTKTPVGRQLSAQTTKVPTSDVTGIPERCSHGPSDTVLVVD